MEPSIRWGVPQARATLMIPGPTELPWPVIQAMNQPPIIQYDQHFDLQVLEPATGPLVRLPGQEQRRQRNHQGQPGDLEVTSR